MKVTRLLMAGILCAGTMMPAMAQFSGVAGGRNSSVPKVFPKSYNRFSVGYNANLLSGDRSGIWLKDEDAKADDGMTLHGFALQYTHGFGLSKAYPMYIEVGARLGMGFYSSSIESKYEGYDAEMKGSLTSLNLTVPVNFAYRFGVGEGLAITPYTGLHLKANILANYKQTLSLSDDYDYADDDDTISLFDKDDVGKDNAWARVQFGWQIGAGLSYKAFYFGLEYGLDFNNLYKKCMSSDLTVSVGLNF